MSEQTGREPVSASATSEKLAHDLGIEAYIYGYPLVLMDATKQVGTNVPKAGENAAPINQFGQKSSFPDDTFTTVVSPNADTLYSFSFLDSQKSRWCQRPRDGKSLLLDGDAGCVDERVRLSRYADHRKRKGRLRDRRPAMDGTLPAGVQEIKSPTNLVWIIGRTQTNGPADYSAVHAIQDQYKLTPLSLGAGPTRLQTMCRLRPVST